MQELQIGSTSRRPTVAEVRIPHGISERSACKVKGLTDARRRPTNVLNQSVFFAGAALLLTIEDSA
jgi:hypothetical protein